MDPMTNRVDKIIKHELRPVNNLKRGYQSGTGKNGNRKATAKQLKYVELYMKTSDKWAAYHGAGYKSVQHKEPRLARRDIYNVHNSVGVQRILGAVLRDTLDDLGVSAKELVSLALRTYHNAETVPDQLAALDLITRIVPVLND
jgi:hypothetical protein